MVKLEQKHLSANNHGEIRAKRVSTIVVKYFDWLRGAQTSLQMKYLFWSSHSRSLIYYGHNFLIRLRGAIEFLNENVLF
jgi:hypothetical protein